MESDNPFGADNQQGSPSHPPCGRDVIPQRLNAELLAVGAKGLEAYRSCEWSVHGIQRSASSWNTG
jgi:hypothetical protein